MTARTRAPMPMPREAGRHYTDVEEIPAVPGAYILLLDTSEPLTVKIAGEQASEVSPGRYLYCGSAKGPGGLRARIKRHMRRDKTVRWHIDQLTTLGAARGAWIFPAGDECALVAQLAHLPTPIVGFGSTDCARCRSHLLRWPEGVALPFLLRCWRASIP